MSTYAEKPRRPSWPPPDISERDCALRADEVEVLALLAEGLPLDTVARHLAVSERTLRRRTRAICDLLGVPAVITAVAIVVSNNGSNTPPPSTFGNPSGTSP